MHCELGYFPHPTFTLLPPTHCQRQLSSISRIMPVQNKIFTAEARRTQREVFFFREITTNKNILPKKPVRLGHHRRRVNTCMWNDHGITLLPVPGLRELVYEECLCHEFYLRGYFRLSVSPDRRKNKSPSLRPLCLCGEPGFERHESSPKIPMKSRLLPMNSAHVGQQ
jgi:hypothetical protein